MKKHFMAVLFACALLATPTQVFAWSNPQNIAAPYMLLIKIAKANLTISSKEATISCSVVSSSDSATKAEIDAELQVKDGYTWRHVADWQTSESGDEAFLSATQTVVPGHTYRVETTVTIWDGDQYESQTIYSPEQTA